MLFVRGLLDTFNKFVKIAPMVYLFRNTKIGAQQTRPKVSEKNEKWRYVLVTKNIV
jgi:hypothetical protein